MRMGFTGTADGTTAAQLNSLQVVLVALHPEEFHHGMCEGADEEMHALIRKLMDGGHIPRCTLHGHPGVTKNGEPYKRADCPGLDEVWPEAPFLVRNANIVRVTDMLVAAPKEDEEQVRSGTWATVRRARASFKPIDFVFPSGRITSEQASPGAKLEWELRDSEVV